MVSITLNVIKPQSFLEIFFLNQFIMSVGTNVCRAAHWTKRFTKCDVGAPLWPFLVLGARFFHEFTFSCTSYCMFLLIYRRISAAETLVRA